MTVWLTPDDVAERLGIARCTALSLMQNMPHSVISGTVRKRIRVSESNLEAWMDRKSTGNPVSISGAKGTSKKLKRR